MEKYKLVDCVTFFDNKRMFDLRFNILKDYIDFSLPTHANSWDEKHGFIWDNSGNQVECSWFGFKISFKSIK